MKWWQKKALENFESIFEKANCQQATLFNTKCLDDIFVISLIVSRSSHEDIFRLMVQIFEHKTFCLSAEN